VDTQSKTGNTANDIWEVKEQKQRCIFLAERNHVGIGVAVEKNMLLILHIVSITQVTGGGITLTPCHCLQT